MNRDAEDQVTNIGCGISIECFVMPKRRSGTTNGFRQAQNIKRAQDGELYFYSQIFGFELADGVESVEIENL